MKENKLQNLQDRNIPSFSEITDGSTIRFVCNLGTKKVGFISATLIGENVYDVGGFFC